MAFSLSQLLSYAQGAGFTGQSANTAAAIAMAESGGNPNAINYSDPGGSYGLTQINGAAWGPGATSTLGNPSEAFNQMFNISQGGTNFTPWSTFNNGSYLNFLNGVGSATGSSGGLGSGLGNFGAGSWMQNLFGGPNSPVGSQLGSGGITSLAGGSGSSQTSWLASIGYFLLGLVLLGIGAFLLAKEHTPALMRTAA